LSIWIFRVFDGVFDMETSPVRGYGTPFKKLSTLYIKLCKAILGVPISSSSLAVYVRLGVLPLRYHLCLRALVWYLRGFHGKAGIVVQKQLFRMYADDEVWMNTCFYQPCYLMLRRLSAFSGVNFWEVPLHKVSSVIRDAMFSELNHFWSRDSTATDTHLIQPIWKYFKFSRICHSRTSSVLFHKCALGRAPFRQFLHRCGKHDSPMCRGGCKSEETISHVFFECKFFNDQRQELKKLCKEKNLEFNITNLFTKEPLQLKVEKIILKFFEESI